MRKLFIFALLVLGIFATDSSRAQSSVPVILQAATAAPAAPAPVSAPPAADLKNVMQLLQEMQSTNTATIKKQEASLATLDALQKAAEEIKIYSKRG